MKKILVLILALVMSVMCFGCQKAQEGSGEITAPVLDVQNP